jgi:hypothetical protein
MQEIIKSNHIISDLEKVVQRIHHDKRFVLTDEHTSTYCFPLIASSELIRTAKHIVIPAKLQTQIENYKQTLYESWEELPPIFVTSSTKGTGREELLDYIEQINRSLE